MRTMSTTLLLVPGELNFVELHLRRRILQAFWTAVRTVRGRNIQGVSGNRPMHPMQRRFVFNRWGYDMPRLFAGLQLVCVEDNLHLQCGLLGARRRQLHSVRGRKLQGFERIISVHRLPTELYLSCGELHSDELHMQRSIHGNDYERCRGLRGVRGRKVQGVSGSRPMHCMCRRHVFSSRGGLRVINMPKLFGRLQLSSRELNLHLQCGLLGA